MKCNQCHHSPRSRYHHLHCAGGNLGSWRAKRRSAAGSSCNSKPDMHRVLALGGGQGTNNHATVGAPSLANGSFYDEHNAACRAAHAEVRS